MDQGTSGLDLLQRVIDAFASASAALHCIDDDVATLQRKSEKYELRFDDSLQFVSMKPLPLVGLESHVDESHVIEASDDRAIEVVGCCEMLPERVDNLWTAKAEADAAIQALSTSILDTLSKMVGKPWQPTVRRECIDWLTIWPGEKTPGYGVRKVSNHVPTLLENADHYDPHDKWQEYRERLASYANDILAVRAEVAEGEPAVGKQPNRLEQAKRYFFAKWWFVFVVITSIVLAAVAAVLTNLKTIQEWIG
ncbi:MAG: hypothetical protein IH899_15060, partial [Planctomycetes bacterium]|nr:hypothetical protein [Planctomycetota bacterium]